MDANREGDGPIDGGALALTGGKREAVDDAVNTEGDHHGDGIFGEAMGGGFIKMAGGAGRADVEDKFADEGKKRIAGSKPENKLPPIEFVKAFRQDAADGDAKEGAGAEGDESAKLAMGAGQERAEAAGDDGDDKGGKDAQNQRGAHGKRK